MCRLSKYLEDCSISIPFWPLLPCLSSLWTTINNQGDFRNSPQNCRGTIYSDSGVDIEREPEADLFQYREGRLPSTVRYLSGAPALSATKNISWDSKMGHVPLKIKPEIAIIVIMDSTKVKNCLALLALFFGLLLLAGCGRSAKDFDSLKASGEQAFGKGDYNLAINKLQQAYRIKPSDRDILFLLGTAFKKVDRYDSAYSYFKRARLLYATDRPINKEILELAPTFNDIDGALNAIAVLIATGDNEKMYWPLLAELNYRREDLQTAAKYFKLLIADNPNDKTYYLYLSNTLAQLGDFQQSNGVLFKTIENFGPSAEAYANIAVNYLNKKDFAAAEEYFRKSLDIDPPNIPIWIDLANVLSEQKDIAKKKEALAIYKKYQEQAPKGFKIDSLIPALETELKK
jgi:tetratricopeptide (TPR) repeat protein